jgi:YtkA-like protein
MHWSRRLVVLLAAGVAALAAVIFVGATALGASDPGPAFPHIAPAVVRQTAVTQRLSQGDYRITVSVRPNRSTALNTVSVCVTRAGRMVSGAHVALAVRMPAMGMAGTRESLRATALGSYVNRGTVLGMIGRWGLRISVAPPRGAPFSVHLADDVRS